jgi:hypothetical protein
MDWRFGLKIREPFTVSAFSLTVWQTLLHILINVYWNKSGFIQTDATHNIVVNSSLACLITESITIYSVHLHFQCNKVYCLHIIWQKILRIILFILDFKIGNGRQSKRLLDNMVAKEDGLWCLTPLSTIYRSVLFVEKAGVPGENHWPVASHRQNVSHNVASSTPKEGFFFIVSVILVVRLKLVVR